MHMRVKALARNLRQTLPEVLKTAVLPLWVPEISSKLVLHSSNGLLLYQELHDCDDQRQSTSTTHFSATCLTSSVSSNHHQIVSIRLQICTHYFSFKTALISSISEWSNSQQSSFRANPSRPWSGVLHSQYLSCRMKFLSSTSAGGDCTLPPRQQRSLSYDHRSWLQSKRTCPAMSNTGVLMNITK